MCLIQQFSIPMAIGNWEATVESMYSIDISHMTMRTSAGRERKCGKVVAVISVSVSWAVDWSFILGARQNVQFVGLSKSHPFTPFCGILRV